MSAVTDQPTATYRLTQYAHGGGCACKIPPGELEEVLAGLTPWTSADLLVGLDTGDDAAVVRIDGDRAIVTTTDFFTAVVDDAYDFGRIAAANALSDIYAMGARPLVALNLVGWPRGVLPMELLREVLRGGMDIGREARCDIAGGQSIDDPEPKYGLAVTGIGDPARLLRNDAAQAGMPISLSKPLGVGVLNNRHKATGEVFRRGDRDDGHAERDSVPGRAGRRADGGNRRHRLRAARSRLQDGPGLRRVDGDRRRRGALSRWCPRGVARRLRQRRHPAQPGLGASAPGLVGE